MSRPNLRIRSLEETEDPDFWSLENENDVWLLVCSVGVGLTTLFLLYRICKDCCMVEGGSRIKRSKLSERLEEQEQEKKEKALRKKEKREKKNAILKAKHALSKKSSSKTAPIGHEANDNNRVLVPSKSTGNGKNSGSTRPTRRPSTGSTVSVGSRSKHEPRRQIKESKSFDNGKKRQPSSSGSLPSSKKKVTATKNKSGSRNPKKAEVKGFLGPGDSKGPKKGTRAKSPPRRPVTNSKPLRVD